MSDRRLTPANGRVASADLRGKVQADNYVQGTAMQLAVPVADLCDAPDGRRDRQMLAGQELTLFEERDGWAFVQAAADGYVGYLRADQLEAPCTGTHRVFARSTHAYTAPDFKAPERESLSFNSVLRVSGQQGRFLETNRGFVSQTQLVPIDFQAPDPVAIAEKFLGTPYLWGGNSGFGIDCSGLVQAACQACGIACPGDSDMQQAALGRDLGNQPPQRGDLLFWKGHVAWVCDADTILHANVHHMAVAYEPMADAIARIEAQGDGPVTARKRLGDT